MTGSRVFKDRRLLLFLVSLLIYSLLYSGYLYSQENDSLEALLAGRSARTQLWSAPEEPAAVAEVVEAFLPVLPVIQRTVRTQSLESFLSRRGERTGSRAGQGRLILLLISILITAVFTLPAVIVRGAVLCPSNRYILRYIQNEDGSK